MAGDFTELVLYADVLFVIDFSMDFISLYFTGKLNHMKMKAYRLCLAAAFGALFSLISTILSPASYAELFLSIACSFVMCLIAFGFSSRYEIIRRTILLWAAGALIGGIMTAATSVGKDYSLNISKTPALYIILAVCVFIAFIMLQTIGRVSTKKSADVTVTLNDKRVEFKALADSGNLLTDPFTGNPVIIGSLEAIRELFNEGEREFFENVYNSPQTPPSLDKRIRLIPSKTVHGEKVLYAIKTDGVKVDGKEKNALIAVENVESGSYGSFDGIVPAALL